MSKVTPTVIMLLLGIFTFNQVILPHVLSFKAKAALCDPIVSESQDGIVEPLLKWNNPDLPSALGIIASLAYSVIKEPCNVSSGVPHFASPHGMHVPVYLDDCVLIV
ncbi:MAG: hypothetical protein K9J06_08965 [Flavobacteriales bacterium]|nr:hypothetical protein [Flavobacteriales bacterium]